MTSLELKNRVEEALWEEDTLDARHIRVVVQGRDVWLEGEVPTPEMYDLADHIAAQTGGVRDLTNNITCSEVPYDIRSHRDGEDLRQEPTMDINREGRLEARMGRFGEEWDEATPLEGSETGGPVGGDSGEPIHPNDLNEEAPMASDHFNAVSPWRYQSAGANAFLEPEPVLPPEEDEV